jgi:hypothetical protein
MTDGRSCAAGAAAASAADSASFSLARSDLIQCSVRSASPQVRTAATRAASTGRRAPRVARGAARGVLLEAAIQVLRGAV